MFFPFVMRQIEREFEKLGLQKYEAMVLGVLYEHAPIGATAIAKHLELSRSSVYTTLASLTAKGLVSTTYRNEVKQFIPTGPESLTQLLQSERRALDAREHVLGDLVQHLTMANRDDLHVPQVLFFEGVEGLKRIYLSMLRDARPGAMMYVLRDEFIWGDLWAFSWEREWRERVRRWKREKDIHTRLLVNASELERGKREFYRTRFKVEFRYLAPNHGVHQFALYLLGDTAAVLSFETGNLLGLKIVNAHLAENFARMYQGLWDGATTE